MFTLAFRTTSPPFEDAAGDLEIARILHRLGDEFRQIGQGSGPVRDATGTTVGHFDQTLDVEGPDPSKDRVYLVVGLDLDPTPGAMHTDFMVTGTVQRMLAQRLGHYHPTVKVLTVQ
jgi:hypothetical protein